MPVIWNVIALIMASLKWTVAWSLTHWGRVTHIYVGNLTIIGSDNGLSPERRQAIIWTNVGILSIGPLGTNFSEIVIEIQTFSLKKIRLKMSSAKCCSFRLGLNVLNADLQKFDYMMECQDSSPSNGSPCSRATCGMDQIITVTSCWAQWSLKSSAPRLFT